MYKVILILDKFSLKYYLQKKKLPSKSPALLGLSSNNNKRMQSFDSIETLPYGMSKDLVNEKEEIKYSNIIKQYKID